MPTSETLRLQDVMKAFERDQHGNLRLNLAVLAASLDRGPATRSDRQAEFDLGKERERRETAMFSEIAKGIQAVPVKQPYYERMEEETRFINEALDRKVPPHLIAKEIHGQRVRDREDFPRVLNPQRMVQKVMEERSFDWGQALRSYPSGREHERDDGKADMER